MRVAAAMSGGVDSSIAAAWMVDGGHEVVGLTMSLGDPPLAPAAGDQGALPSPVADARRVCDTLGIKHHVVDLAADFRREIVEPFADAYRRGLTPNPCVTCNVRLKFGALWSAANALGAERLVTGHYVRRDRAPEGHWRLRQAVDRRRDQSYFLFRMTQEMLARTDFPLGHVTKQAVRAEAEIRGLHVANKPDSEDICFVPGGDYAAVVEKVLGAGSIPPPGPIVDEEGVGIGQHRGVHRFTIGQRRGLGVSANRRLYVLSIDGSSQILTAGSAEHLAVDGLFAEGCVWVRGTPPASGESTLIRIRHGHGGVVGTVWPDADAAELRFESPEPAVAPGQAAVLYDGDIVLGGGWIARTFRIDR